MVNCNHFTSFDVHFSEGDTIPAGTNIAVSIVDVHFSSKHYPDPWNFNPENFEPELTNSRSKYAYLPFAAGPRDCLGNSV